MGYKLSQQLRWPSYSRRKIPHVYLGHGDDIASPCSALRCHSCASKKAPLCQALVGVWSELHGL